MRMVTKNFVFGDRQKSIDKIKIIEEGGKEKFHAIFDFDRTLTPSRNENGKEVATWKLLNRHLPADKRVLVDALYKKYRPMEVGGKMTVEDAKKWWSTVLDTYKGRNLKWSELAREVDEAVPMRAGARELFDVCSQKGIPTIIISAGIKDVIELWCQKFEILPTKIISTNLYFDGAGYVCGWEKGSLIHNFNKRERGHGELAEIRKKRPNILLVGDNVEDADMAEGEENVLRVFIDDAREDDTRDDNFYSKIFKKFDLTIKNGSLLPLARMIQKII